MLSKGLLGGVSRVLTNYKNGTKLLRKSREPGSLTNSLNNDDDQTENVSIVVLQKNSTQKLFLESCRLRLATELQPGPDFHHPSAQRANAPLWGLSQPFC